ncbi:DegT/DnrJ/EryC1/StrS family aminotransferase [Wenyingzhuangia sp. IMCC45467]
MSKKINVTKTFLPDQSEYQKILKKAWDSSWITNRGELVKELEECIKTKLKLSNIILTTNGTLPLQIAIKSLQLKDEIITTPFSYIATTSSIIWEGCKPIFVDIDEKTFNINPELIEQSISKNTTAILATHVFGNPCEVEKIEKIANKHNLRVIYDAAHCFGTSYKGKSIFEYGDISTCSFHATKIFHTGEGGAIFTKNKELHKKIYYHHNFGHNGPTEFHGLGINAKMSELQAALGLAVFPYFDSIIEHRKRSYELYKKRLESSFLFQKLTTFEYNYSYMPIVFDSEEELLIAIEKLTENNIFPRRYFYPSLNTIPYVNGNTAPISESISKRILCLPLYFNLEKQKINEICDIILP